MRNKFYLGIVALLLFACGGKKEEKITPPVSADKLKVDVVIGIASIEPAERIVQLTTESAGVVKTIHVQVSQQVKRGELLFSLSDEVEAAQVNQAQSKLRTQQSIIESQQATVGSLDVQLQNAKTNFDRTQKLFAGQAATQQQLDDSRFAFENTTQQKLAATANLQQQIAKKAELQADLSYYQSLLNRKHIQIGNYVSTATVLGEFAPEGGLVAITEIDELFADRLKVGQRASIRPQGDSTILANEKNWNDRTGKCSNRFGLIEENKFEGDAYHNLFQFYHTFHSAANQQFRFRINLHPDFSYPAIFQVAGIIREQRFLF